MKGHNHAYPGVRCPACRRVEVMCLVAVALWCIGIPSLLLYLVLR